ncbi:hypothetical protein GVAV_000854 [Gurleya vavrai]
MNFKRMLLMTGKGFKYQIKYFVIACCLLNLCRSSSQEKSIAGPDSDQELNDVDSLFKDSNSLIRISDYDTYEGEINCDSNELERQKECNTKKSIISEEKKERENDKPLKRFISIELEEIMEGPLHVPSSNKSSENNSEKESNIIKLNKATSIKLDKIKHELLHDYNSNESSEDSSKKDVDSGSDDSLYLKTRNCLELDQSKNYQTISEENDKKCTGRNSKSIEKAKTEDDKEKNYKKKDHESSSSTNLSDITESTDSSNSSSVEELYCGALSDEKKNYEINFSKKILKRNSKKVKKIIAKIVYNNIDKIQNLCIYIILNEVLYKRPGLYEKKHSEVFKKLMKVPELMRIVYLAEMILEALANKMEKNLKKNTEHCAEEEGVKECLRKVKKLIFNEKLYYTTFKNKFDELFELFEFEIIKSLDDNNLMLKTKQKNEINITKENHIIMDDVKNSIQIKITLQNIIQEKLIDFNGINLSIDFAIQPKTEYSSSCELKQRPEEKEKESSGKKCFDCKNNKEILTADIYKQTNPSKTMQLHE